MSESRFRIKNIPAALVDRFWKYAEPYVKRALDHTSGEVSAANLKEYAQNGFVQLWLVSEGEKVVAAITTEIILYPQRKHLRIITLAGSNAPEWTADVDTIMDDWARVSGCVAIEAFVRKGYVPVLSKYGYKFKHSVIVKEIE